MMMNEEIIKEGKEEEGEGEEEAKKESGNEKELESSESGKVEKRFFEKRKELDNHRLRLKIVELRNKGHKWEDIVDEVKRLFNVKISIPTALKIFREELALSITKSPRARDEFYSAFALINQRYERAVKMIDDLADCIEKLRRDLDVNNYIKYGPLILATAREIVNQLEFIRRQQEQIRIQQQNIILNPVQISQYIHQNLEELEKKGYIRILIKKDEKDEINEDEINE